MPTNKNLRAERDLFRAEWEQVSEVAEQLHAKVRGLERLTQEIEHTIEQLTSRGAVDTIAGLLASYIRDPTRWEKE